MTRKSESVSGISKREQIERTLEKLTKVKFEDDEILCGQEMTKGKRDLSNDNDAHKY